MASSRKVGQGSSRTVKTAAAAEEEGGDNDDEDDK
jgi:hypothetical protein